MHGDHHVDSINPQRLHGGGRGGPRRIYLRDPGVDFFLHGGLVMYMGLERSQCLYIGERVVYMGVTWVLLGEEADHHVKRVYIAKYALRHVNGCLDGLRKPFPM